MKPSEVTIEWLASLNPSMQDYPDNNREIDLDGFIASYLEIFRKISPQPEFEIYGEESTYMLHVRFPLDALVGTRDRTAWAYLSKFNKTHVIWCEWFVKSDILEQFISDTGQEGFVYVPFSLFASKDDYPLGEVYPISYESGDGTPVAATLVDKKPGAKFKSIRHPDVFNSLFGFI